MKFGFTKPGTSLYRTVQSIFRYLEPFRRDFQECRVRRDGRTDIVIANAASNYVSRQKVLHVQNHNTCLAIAFFVSCWLYLCVVGQRQRKTSITQVYMSENITNVLGQLLDMRCLYLTTCDDVNVPTQWRHDGSASDQACNVHFVQSVNGLVSDLSTWERWVRLWVEGRVKLGRRILHTNQIHLHSMTPTILTAVARQQGTTVATLIPIMADRGATQQIQTWNGKHAMCHTAVRSQDQQISNIGNCDK